MGVVVGNKASKLFVLCQRPDYQTPCKPGQKWHCVRDGFRFVFKLESIMLYLMLYYFLSFIDGGNISVI